MANELETVAEAIFDALPEPETLRELERRGLIVVREEWKDNFVRVTDEAFALLAEGAE